MQRTKTDLKLEHAFEHAVQKWTKVLHDFGYQGWDNEIKELIFDLIIQQSYTKTQEEYKKLSSFENQCKQVLKIIEKAMICQEGKVSTEKLHVMMKKFESMTKKFIDIAHLK